MSSKPESQEDSFQQNSSSDWTYPTRICRFCREDVAPTVTLYPPGLPFRFQRVNVEYKNDDEYGRLIKPCMCRGSSRYIHELCLQQLRTESRQVGTLWTCQDCGFKFRFQKLTIHRFLSSKLAAGVLTMLAMMLIIFALGFVADPILNLYLDPYDEYSDRESLWDELEIQLPRGLGSGWIHNVVKTMTSAWSQHFMKGMVSMGVVGFLKMVIMNPLHWFHIRSAGLTSGLTGGTRMTGTGRDRAMNVNLIVILIGIFSAFYFFYQWMQVIIQMLLRRVSSHILNTQLPQDDDDLTPPAGWKYEPPATESSQQTSEESEKATRGECADGVASEPESAFAQKAALGNGEDQACRARTSGVADSSSLPTGQESGFGRSTGIDTALDQSWSFVNI